MKRITDRVLLGQAWLGRPADAAWYIDRIERSSSRFEAETRLLQALDDQSLSDDDFHRVRVHFDGRVKGWTR